MGSNSYSYSNKSSASDLANNFTEFQRFLSYLLSHPEASPFNPTQLAKNLRIPVDHIVDYFQSIRHTFELFKTLDQQHAFKWRHVVQSSTNSDQIQILVISKEDIQNFSDLVYLTAKIPLKMSFVSSNDSFKRLIESYPSFFVAGKNRWRISPTGLFFAKQFKAFKKLNTIPNQLEYKNLILKIQKE
jgi:hypothetical protein